MTTCRQLAWSGALVSLLLLWGTMTGHAEITGIGIVPQYPNPVDSIRVTVDGYFPDACYHFDSSYLGRMQDTFLINTWTTTCHPQCGACANVIVPYKVVYSIAPLPAGTYTVLVREWLHNNAGVWKSDSAHMPFVVGCVCPHQGDCNGDGVINAVDVIFLIGYAFSNGPVPPSDPECPLINRGDWDCNGQIDLSDLIKMVSYTYRSPAPGPCNPCGP